MKRLLSTLMLTAAAVVMTLGLLGACAVPAPGAAPNQQAIDATYASYASLDQAILAADKAVVAGQLKGGDAQRALVAFKTAKAGLDSALVVLKASVAGPVPVPAGVASPPAPPSSTPGASK